MLRTLVIALSLLAGLSLSCGQSGPPDPEDFASLEISPSEVGELSLADGTTLTIPSGAVEVPVTVTLSQRGIPPAPAAWDQPVGSAVKIDIGGGITLAKPALLQLPYDEDTLPVDVPESLVVAATYEESAGEWVPIGGTVDADRQVVSVELLHASWWQPSSWIVDAIVQGIVTGLKLDWSSIVDAFAAFDGCAPTENGVIIDEAASRDYLGSCVETDDALHPRLRIVNRRTFHVSAYPVSGAPTDLPNPGEPLGRLERRSFTVDFSDAPVSEPLVVRAEVEWSATFGHALLDMFDLIPGLDVATSTESILLELYRNRHFISAVEALSSGDQESFLREFPAALEDAADILERFTNFPLRLLLPVFRVLSVAGIGLQFLDAARSASGGPGDLKFYSNRPASLECPLDDREFCEFTALIDRLLTERSYDEFMAKVVFELGGCSVVQGRVMIAAEVAPLWGCMNAIPNFEEICHGGPGGADLPDAILGSALWR